MIETNYPDIAKEWHPTKNGDLKPNQVFPKSNIKYVDMQKRTCI